MNIGNYGSTEQLTYNSQYLSITGSYDGALRLNRLATKSNDWNYIEFYGRNGTRDAYVGTNQNGDIKISSDHGGALAIYSTYTDIEGDGALKVPDSTTGDRPTGQNGMIRYNTTTAALESYIGGGWMNIAVSSLESQGYYNNNTLAVADDLYAYWNCDSTSTTRSGGDSGGATLYGVSSTSGLISNAWDRGGNGSSNSLDYTNGIQLTSMPNSSAWSFSFQLYLHNDEIWSSSDGAGILWLDGRTSGGAAGSVILGYDGNSGDNLRFGGNGWISDGSVVESSFAEQQWYHMVITKSNSTTWKFYLNGSLITTRTETMTESATWMIGNYSRINGNGNHNAHYFRGKVDELAIWHRTLTAAEVSAIYTAQNTNGNRLIT